MIFLNTEKIILLIMLSKIDHKIIEILQKDAKTPITQVAKEVNMSENGVKYRLDKLEQKDVIKRYALFVDPKMVGKNVTAVFDIEIEPNKVTEYVDLLSQLDELTKIYSTTGTHSIMAVGLFDTNEDLDDFVKNKFLKNFPPDPPYIRKGQGILVILRMRVDIQVKLYGIDMQITS